VRVVTSRRQAIGPIEFRTVAGLWEAFPDSFTRDNPLSSKYSFLTIFYLAPTNFLAYSSRPLSLGILCRCERLWVSSEYLFSFHDQSSFLCSLLPGPS